ncbi:hypothetical protein BDAP_000604 [Binucleata daphniae]
MSLAKYASEIIKTCVKTNKPYKQTRYGLEWECWKIESEDDYQKLTENVDKARMLYIDGFYDGHDSYEEFISHYLTIYKFIYSVKYKIVINLQKNVNNKTTYIDTENLSNEITKKWFFKPIKIIKFINHLGAGIFVADEIDVAIAVRYKISRPFFRIKCNEKILFCDCLLPVFKYIQKVEHARYRTKKNLEYFKESLCNDLNLKMIQLDEIEMCRRIYAYSLTFMTFVKKRKQEIKTIEDEDTNQYKEVDYEVVIITMIKLSENKFQHITTYPVCDANGKHPVTNYDTEDIYYKRISAQHDKLQSLLDVLHNTYQNDCIIDDQKSLLLHNLLDLRKDYLRRYVKMTDVIKLKDSDITLHDKNIGFIKKLQLEFGGNITIELYNVKYNTKDPLNINGYGWSYDFLSDHSYKNKIDLDAYIEGNHDNIDVVMMILHITNTIDGDSTYYLLHNKYTNKKDLKIFKKYISENNEQLCTELKTRTLEQMKKYYRFKNVPCNHPAIVSFCEEQEIVIDIIIKYAQKDFEKFIENDYNFCQMILLNVKNELVDEHKKNDETKDKLDEGNNCLKAQLHTMEFYPNNTNETTSQQAKENDIHIEQNVKFILNNYENIHEIDEFIHVLVPPTLNLFLIARSSGYPKLLETMRMFLIDIIFDKKNIKLGRDRKLYLQLNQITAAKDDLDTLTKCINETFDKRNPKHKIFNYATKLD